MKSTVNDQYVELVGLMQLHLLQEFSLSDRLMTDSETFEFYKQYALQKRPQAPIPQVAPKIAPPIIKTIPEKKVESVNELPEPIKMPKVEPIIEEVQKKSDTNLDDIFKMVTERFPNQVIIKEIPSDEEARAINNAWKKEWIVPDIMILSFGEPQTQNTFLNNMAKAISIYGRSTTVVQAENLHDEKKWEAIQKSKSLRLIIASSHGLHASPELSKHYREVQKQAKMYLGNVPLYLLTDIGNYLKNPGLKSSLWNDLSAYA